jgi:hypothetical protein
VTNTSLGDPAGHDRVEAVRQRGAVGLVDDELLGLGAPAHDAEHPVADGMRPDALAERDDLARELEPRDVGRRARRRGVEPEALDQVRPVDPGSPHPHQDLARARHRRRALADLHRPVPGEDHRPHGA